VSCSEELCWNHLWLEEADGIAALNSLLRSSNRSPCERKMAVSCGWRPTQLCKRLSHLLDIATETRDPRVAQSSGEAEAPGPPAWAQVSAPALLSCVALGNQLNNPRSVFLSVNEG